MSYQIEIIITDGREVRAVYGSKDMSLFTKIKIDDHDEYDYLLENHFDLSTKELSSKKLMENIINGTTDKYYTHLLIDKANEKFGKSTLGAIYGYLERDICLHYGKSINRNEDNWPMLTQYLDEFENRNRSYFKRPYSLDFPHAFCILNEELDEYKKLYSSKLKEKYPENENLKKDIEFIFDEARKEDMDIFLCNY
ncbi:hypothetical protein SAMN05444274_1253 [Mariniphaga anaerophila]|uniref:DUF7691 domain-containing protein n=1 Tax=Mariniphaga anaerophila TaxID=1484053 RepID=A0A1M5GK26_9BACT|nr:hypothetical protein [Mariniphaga anaerophila]SHG04067.1 hypothetical protein SAMN05444274_1253 [Mariniphaga anaerophila]